MIYLDTVQLEKITFRMVKERVLGVIPVLIQAHSNQEGRTDQGLAIEAGGSNGSDVAKEEIDNNEDGKVNAEPVEDDEVPLAAAESDRVLSPQTSLGLTKVSQDLNLSLGSSLKLGKSINI